MSREVFTKAPLNVSGDIDFTGMDKMKAVTKFISGIKWMVCCLSLAMVVLVAGCGGGGGGGGGGAGDAAGVHSTEATETTGTEETTEATGTASLSWVAPTTRVDSSPLAMSEIGGYKVYMGSSMQNLALVTNISDAYQMEYVVENLGPGTYYFAVTAYNQYGMESDFSVIASKSI